MNRYKALPITTDYWKPGADYLEELVESIRREIQDKDFVVISEKAISIALSNILDESDITASFNAKLIGACWMRVFWGVFLGRLCLFREDLLRNLRRYPLKMGSCHKQVALQYSGLLQALMFGSEGGIDGSNVAYSYVALPLSNAGEVAQRIFNEIRLRLQKKVCVIIVDTDKTYSIGSFHFTPRPKPIKGIHSFGGFATYVIGRMLRLKRRATPLAVAGCRISVEEALEIARIANNARGFGAGRTVWDMADTFKVELHKVSWQMLETVKHKPIVIVRGKR